MCLGFPKAPLNPVLPSVQIFYVHFSNTTPLVVGYCHHYDYVIMGTMASRITSLTIVYSTVYSGADQRKHQSSVSLAFVRGIRRGPVNSPHKWPITQKMFPFDDVIMDATFNSNCGVGSMIQSFSLLDPSTHPTPNPHITPTPHPHWFCWTLSKWQLPVKSTPKLSSKWRDFRFNVWYVSYQLSDFAHISEIRKYQSTNDSSMHSWSEFGKQQNIVEKIRLHIYTETEMLSFWRNFRHWIHQKLSFWPLFTVTSHGHHGVSNYQELHCLFYRLFRCTSKKTSKLRLTGFCEGNPPATGGFPSQRASNAENVSISWRHHVLVQPVTKISSIYRISSRNMHRVSLCFVCSHMIIYL